MKQYAFMGAMMITSMAYAATVNPDCSIISKITNGEMPVKKNGVYVMPGHDTKEDVMHKGLTSARKCLRKTAGPTVLFALDSVVGRMDNGDYTQKEVYKYDEAGNSKEASFYNWDTTSSEWLMNKRILMDWDEHKRCTLDEVIYFSEWGDSGQRNVNVYNDEDMSSRVDIYMYDNGEWTVSQRSLYKYDEHGFTAEELIQLPGEADGSWVNVIKNVAEWTPEGLRTLAEQYSWNGSEWVPTGSRMTYEYDETGRIVYSLHEIWTGSNWRDYIRIVQEWGEFGVTYQSYEIWNEENRNWFGDMIMTSIYSTIEYDHKGRSIKECAYSYNLEKEDWVEHHRQVSDYTDLENGDVREEQSLYDTTGEPVLITFLIKDTNKAGYVTYWMQSVLDEESNEMMPFEEKIYNYAENGIDVVLSEEYEYNDGIRIANTRVRHIYSEDGYPDESWYQYGTYFLTGEGDPEEWMNYTYFDYEYDHGEETSRMAYRWQDDEYVSFWGQALDFDFNTAATECLYWVSIDLGVDYKTTASRSYKPNGKDWMCEEAIWYYSDMKLTDVTNVEAPTLKVYPNPAIDHINVEGANGKTVNIYNLQGSLMISSDSERIDVSELTPGLYILNIDGKTVKMIKK